jgi:hypothetical protein
MAVHEEAVDSGVGSQSGWLRVVTIYVLEIPKIRSDVIVPRAPQRNVLLRALELRLSGAPARLRITLTLLTIPTI